MDARAGFEDALRRYRELDLPFQVAQASMSMAHALGVADPAVRAVADDGRLILVRLGATPFIRNIDRLLAAADGPRETPIAEVGAIPAE